jgi:tetratricopeptide (TPR) repeat protein
MTRTDIIQYLIYNIKASKYLEIGISNRENFDKIVCDLKVGVDPEPLSKATFCLPSDEFFKTNTETFDVIFIDGLHHADQVYRDIINSLEILNKGGAIVCHDMNPIKEEHQKIPFTAGLWNGDCWKALVQLRQERSDLEIYTVNTDHGCSVIQKGSQEVLPKDIKLTFGEFDKNRKEWLNLIDTGTFYNKLKANLQSLLKEYLQNPTNPNLNWNIALEYFNLGQTAAAVSFFIRCAERTDDILLQYECLLKTAECYRLQGGRSFTVEGLMKQAIALLPTQPEAYFILAEYYQQESKWIDGYTIASIGETVANTQNIQSLRTSTSYPGKYGLTFLRAVNGWWCGLTAESKKLLRDLIYYAPLNPLYKNACRNNFNILKLWKTKQENKSWFKNTTEEINAISKYPDTLYLRDIKNLKIPFKNSELISHSFSEFLQDIFVLTALDGKTDGTYVELGAGHPFYGNNTALLETKYNWKGVSVDYATGAIEEFFRERNNIEILADATTMDYVRLFQELNYPTTIDYLQIDCDPAHISYKTLLKIPFHAYEFKVITFEHDHSKDETGDVREDSRKYLEKKGYTLILTNIGKDNITVEDWWVNSKYIDIERLKPIIDISDKIKYPKNIFLI